MRIRKRWLLVVLVAAAQIVCLVAGLVAFNWWQSKVLTRIVRQRVFASTQQHAAQTVRLIENLGLRDLTVDTQDWQLLQKIVEQTDLPDEAFLCVINDRTGRVLCHPRLRVDPSVADLDLGHLRLEGPGQGRTVLEVDASGDASADGGWARLDDDTHLIVVKQLAGLGARLVVHQKEGPVRGVIRAVSKRTWQIGLMVGLGLVLTTAALTIWLTRRYDNHLTKINEGLQDTVDERSKALLRSRDAVIFGLAKLAESRDDQTGEHLERICEYVELLARELARRDPQFDEKWVRTLRETAALHDVGKVGIPDAVLLKPGPLTDREREVMRTHPHIGGDTLMAIKRRWGDDPYLVVATQIVFGHHEHWDGSGYPFGLKGENIPLSARIVAVADVYDALTSARVYKRAFDHETARKVIVEGSGGQFDPRVVEVFKSVEDRFRRIAAESGNGKQRAEGGEGFRVQGSGFSEEKRGD